MNFVRYFVPVSILATSATVQATPPPPSPMKMAENFEFSCSMLSEDSAPVKLTVKIRYERKDDNNWYWWTLAGNDQHFPSNPTAMRSLEYEYQNVSGLGFEIGNWRYNYVLHYAVEERFPAFVFVPDHLIVRRIDTRDKAAAWKQIGIGHCDLTKSSNAS